MKNIKRILAVVLCTAMLFSFCLVQAEETSAQAANVCGLDAVGLINALGISDFTEEQLSENMTKIEFYEFAAKLGGYPKSPVGLQIFADLVPGEDGEAYARTLNKVDIIAPDANGNIYPQNPITPVEAASIMVKLLGYSPVAETKGGYPAGYLSLAASLKLTSCVDMGKNTLTKGEAAEMAYAALECDIMTQSVSVNGSATEYKVEKDTTLLETNFGVEIIEGVVDGVDITRIFGDNDVRPFHIEIDGREIYVEDLYMDNLTEAYDYLGYDVNVYAKEQRGYGTSAVYIEKTHRNEEHIFDIEDIVEITSSTMKAYEPDGDKVKNYRFKKAVPLVYNGVATAIAFDEALIEGKSGTIKLVDNTGDNTADVVFAEIYDNIIVSNVDAAKLVVYDEIVPGKKINVDNDADDPYVMIFDNAGEEINPSDIKKGNVLSVFESASDAQQAFSKIYVSSAIVSGEIEAIEDKDEIIVNGTLYEISDNCLKNNGNFVRVGTAVTLYLDINGVVAYIDGSDGSEATEYAMGFLMAAGTETGLDGKLKIKICTAPEEYVEADVAKNVTIDDIRYSNTDEAIIDHLHVASLKMFPTSQNPDMVSSFVKFGLNGNGEVTVIDTIMHDIDEVATRYSYLTDKNSLYAVHQQSAYHRRSGNHLTLGNGVVLSKTATLFGYPDLGDKNISVFDEDMYSLATFTSEVPSGKTVQDVWAFYSSRDQIICDYVAQPYTKKVGGSDDENAYFAIVGKKSKIANPENDAEIIDCITLMTNNGEVKLHVANNLTFAGLNMPAEDPDNPGQLLPVEDPDLVGTPVGEAKPGASTKLTVDDLKLGDIVKYAVDYKGYLSEITFYYRPTTDTVVTTSGYFGAVTSVINWYKGYVYDTYPEGFFLYTSKDLTGNIEEDKKILENVTMEDCQFVYYTGYTSCASAGVDYSETNDKLRIKSISMANLKSYVETGDDCTYGILQRYYTYPRMFISIEGHNN